MTIRFLRPASSLRASILTLSALVATAAWGITPQARITSQINNQSRAVLPGTLSPHARPDLDAGAVPATMPLSSMTLVFSRTPAQQAALDALTVAQQNPASPEYHQFLTPAQFGAQFGVTASDITATESWLQQQGFTIERVARSQDRIVFSGTVAQVEAAFGTQLHYYNSASGKHFAPSTALTVPAALSSSVLTVTGLSSFRPKPHVVFHKPILAQPAFTSGQTGSFYLTPKDVATIYDVNAAYNAGYTGTGQTIAVIGQSAIVQADITNFQTALGVTPKPPTVILVPSTGTSTIYTGDESESDLDLEYSGAMAPGATVYFVYTGNSNNDGVFDALQYAVNYKTANIITMSYGDCETDMTSAQYSSLDAILQQGAAQGQTILTSAGDSGSTDCWPDTNLTLAQRQTPAVDFPASSQYVTAMGGTEFPQADLTSTYFNASTGTDIISSAKSYIPEQAWNDDAASAASTGVTAADVLSSGGGGVSIYTPRPAWQIGVPGIPSGTFRLVPDISLAASPDLPGYLYCSSDNNSTGLTGSCSNGFRDSNDQYLTVAGGTSFDAPIFAGLVAVINQAKGYTAGQGLVNPELYTLASNSSTYASDFHDIVNGGNQCLAGASYCSTAGKASFAATTGYDEATGLGSIDFYNLLSNWPANSVVTTTNTTTTTVSPAALSPAVGANDVVTITVASASGLVTTNPTGTVSVSVDGSVVNASLVLTNGVATYTFASSVSGAHTIAATYSGDGTFAASNGSASVNVGNISFTLSPSLANVPLTAGASGTVNLTASPVNGYTGTINVAAEITGPSTINSSDASDFCILYPSSFAITSATTVSGTVSIYTSSSTCKTAGAAQGGAAKRSMLTASGRASNTPPPSPWHRAPVPAAFAGLMLAMAFTRRRSRKLRGLLSVALLALFGLGVANLTGCSNNSTPNTTTTTTTTTAPTGIYTIYITGQDSVNPALMATTSFTITVQ